jgi:hypothetical protein
MSKKNKKMPKGAPPEGPPPQMMQMPSPQQAPGFASIWTKDGERQPDYSKWYIIYPNYVNSLKTLHLGRRIPIEKGCKYPCHFCSTSSLICVFYRRKSYSSRDRGNLPVLQAEPCN